MNFVLSLTLSTFLAEAPGQMCLSGKAIPWLLLLISQNFLWVSGSFRITQTRWGSAGPEAGWVPVEYCLEASRQCTWLCAFMGLLETPWSVQEKDLGGEGPSSPSQSLGVYFMRS